MRISDWSSDVCSSDLTFTVPWTGERTSVRCTRSRSAVRAWVSDTSSSWRLESSVAASLRKVTRRSSIRRSARSEEHTSELQSLMRISYAVFCLKKKKKTTLCKYNTNNTKKHTNTRNR